jgi:hypothetical protein
VPTNVGAELASVPFGKMIYDMASAIARSQVALDSASIQLVRVLANTYIDYVPDVTEVLLPNPKTITGIVDPSGNPVPVTVTGVTVSGVVGDPFPLTLLQAGVNPTFYAFTNSTISIKISVTSTTDTSLTVSAGTTSSGQSFFFGGGTMASHVNASYSAKYSYSVGGSSSLQTTLATLPPPKGITPRFFLVNAMDPNHIQITQS